MLTVVLGLFLKNLKSESKLRLHILYKQIEYIFDSSFVSDYVATQLHVSLQSKTSLVSLDWRDLALMTWKVKDGW